MLSSVSPVIFHFYLNIQKERVTDKKKHDFKLFSIYNLLSVLVLIRWRVQKIEMVCTLQKGTVHYNFGVQYKIYHI